MKKELIKTIFLFFSKLMLGLSKKNFICPEPIQNKENKYISDFQNKKIYDCKLFRR